MPTTRQHPAKIFGRALKLARENNTTYSQEDVARLMGTSQQNVSRWEQGTIPMPIQHLKDICQILKADYDEMLKLAGDAHTAGPSMPTRVGRINDLEDRVTALEEEMREMRKKIS